MTRSVEQVWNIVLKKFCDWITDEFPENIDKLKPLKTEPFWAIMERIRTDLKPAFNATELTLDIPKLEAALNMKLKLNETQLKTTIDFVDCFISIANDALKNWI